MNNEFRSLKPSGREGGIIPVAPDKVQSNEVIKDFLIGRVSNIEISNLEKIFFKEIKMKELEFMYPEIQEKPNFIKMRDYQPLQLVMRASVRYLKKNYQKCLVGVTPHYIIFANIDEKEKKKRLVYIGNIHVMEIKKLFHGRNYEKVPFLQIRLLSQYIDNQKVKLNATFTNPDYELIKNLTKIVYRNFSLAYANSDFRPQLLFAQTISKDVYEMDEDDEQSEKDFPKFDDFILEKLSPSQRFQFTYAANCSHDSVPYNHDIVTYFHSQVINYNGVFNASYIPKKNKFHYEMVPLFRSLIYSEYIHGIVCDAPQPEIFKAVSYQLIRSQKIKFLHLSNVNASEGLSDLYINMYYNRENCQVVYFDFSRNNIKDELINLKFDKEFLDKFPQKKNTTFFDIFKDYKTEVIYFSFNECNFEKEHLISLFDAMKNYKSLQKIKYLHISNSKLIGEPIDLLKDYFNISKTLVSLDIGNMPEEAKDIEKVIKLVEHQPLECLYLYNDKITDTCFEFLKELIIKKPSLSVLDVSGTGITSEHVAVIVESMSSRLNYRLLTIKASRLGIYGIGTSTIMRGFLNGQLDQWETIYLDSNNMKTYDLQLLIPLFQQMANLRELSLSDNFDGEMIGIEQELCNILRIPGLRILHLAGSTKNQLGDKIKPLILAIALSYQIRNKICGLSICNRERDQKKFSKKANELFDAPKLKVKDGDQPICSKFLQRKFDHILKPFLMETNVNDVINNFDKNQDEWPKIFSDLVPLIEKCSGIYQYQKSDIRKKSISDCTLDILVEWDKKKPSDDKTPLEEKVEANCKRIDKATWINMAANLSHLKYFDIKNVKIELDVVTSLLKIDKELRGIEFDGCGIEKISTLTDLIETVEDQQNLIKVPFPFKDKLNLLNSAIEDARPVVRRDLDSLQFRLMNAVNKNRSAISRSDEDKIIEYPFETIPEIQNNIKMPRHSKKNLRSHSGICKDFRMQLPYLHLDRDDIFYGLPDDYYIDTDDIIEKMCVYEFESPPNQDTPPEKSTAIQERFYENDPEELLSDDDDENEEEEYSDDSQPPVNTDLDHMKKKISDEIHWDFNQSEQPPPPSSDYSEEEEETPNDDDKSEEESDSILDEISEFDLSENRKPKYYSRKNKELTFLSSTNIPDESSGSTARYSNLDTKIEIKKNYGGIDMRFRTAQEQVKRPPK